MNPAQLRLLRESFEQIKLRAPITGLVFYRNLFALDPSLRPLFQTDIEIQGRKLMEALSYVVATLENPQALVPSLEAMGRRHVGYGVRDEHYATVTKAMLQSLHDILREEFKPGVRAAWATALRFVCDTMKQGAAPVVALQLPV